MSVEPTRRSFDGAELIPFPKRWRAARSLGAMVREDALMIERWVRRWRHRRAMEMLAETQPDSILRDIGITRIDAWREARKPFWMA